MVERPQVRGRLAENLAVFINPPPRSRLKLALDAMNADAPPGPAAFWEFVFDRAPAIVETQALKAGAPPAEQRQWAERALAVQVELLRQAAVANIAKQAEAEAARPRPCPLTEAVIVAYFELVREWRARRDENAGLSTADAVQAAGQEVAESLGPGLGAVDVLRLVHWHYSRVAALVDPLAAKSAHASVETVKEFVDAYLFNVGHYELRRPDDWRGW